MSERLQSTNKEQLTAPELNKQIEHLNKPYSREKEKQDLNEQAELLKSSRQEIAGLETSLPTSAKPSVNEKGLPFYGTQKKKHYRQTMHQVRYQLPRTQRTFSKFVHVPAIEKVSEIAGSTILRPLPLLGAGVVASLVTGLAYLLARLKGYGINGSGWLILGLSLGYLVGLAIDIFRLLLNRHQHS